MKKLLSLAALAAVSMSVCAQDLDDPESTDDVLSLPEPGPASQKVSYWPAFLGVNEFPETPDLVGVRITIPYSTKQESVTGFDVGFWGRSQYFEGFQLNLLRNDVKDQLSGGQLGLYNTAARADLFGIQAGAWNEAGSLRGGQLGLVNVVSQMQGVQIGIINRAEELYGFQFGLVNVIRDGEIAFCPIVNIGF